MSDSQNRGIRDFSKYDSMATEDLEEILRLDAEAPEEQESDIELLLYVMEVLAGRRRNNSNGTGNTALEAFESFKQHYLPCNTSEGETVNQEKKRPKKTARWLRRLTAVAAMLAVIACASFTATAFGCDVWNTFAKWTAETFHFTNSGQPNVSEPKPDNDLQHASLQEALADYGYEGQIVPSWIPERFQLSEIIIDQNPVQDTFIAIYTIEESMVKISVRSYANSDPEQIERSEGFVEAYEKSGIVYYIFSNYDQNRAVWINGSYECYISGDLTIEELKMILDSIEKG